MRPGHAGAPRSLLFVRVLFGSRSLGDRVVLRRNKVPASVRSHCPDSGAKRGCDPVVATSPLTALSADRSNDVLHRRCARDALQVQNSPTFHTPQSISFSLST